MKRQFEFVEYIKNGEKTNSIQELTRELLNDNKVEIGSSLAGLEKCLKLLELDEILNCGSGNTVNKICLYPKNNVEDEIAISSFRLFDSKYKKFIEEGILINNKKAEILYKEDKKGFFIQIYFIIAMIIFFVIIYLLFN